MSKPYNTVRVLIFDTETSGSPKHYKPAHEDIDNYPYALQFSAKLIDIDLNNLNTYKLIYSTNMLISPTRQTSEFVHHIVDIDPKAEAIHNITKEKLELLGDDISNVAMIYQGLTNSADFIISHNYTLHKNVMVAELLRLGIRARYSKRAKVLCMMKYSAPILAVPTSKKDNFRFPTPPELFKHLTDEEASDYFPILNDASKDTDLYIVNLLQLLQQQNDLFQWLNGDIQDLYTKNTY